MKNSQHSKKIRLLLSYEGSRFKGWQKQPHTSETVQGHLEKALSQIYSQPLSVIGAGRTDTGVHALAQTAHFNLPHSNIPRRLVLRLNALTPPEISCHQAWLAPSEFHAQISALKRTYTYVILNTKTPSAFKHSQGLWLSRPIDFDKLKIMAQEIIGEKDFKSFQNAGTNVQTTKKKVFSAQWFWVQPQILVFQITANSFLKQMVRNLVGTQLQLMTDSDPIKKLKYIFQSKDRKKAFQTAPAHGLFLHRVFYPSLLDRKCQKL